MRVQSFPESLTIILKNCKNLEKSLLRGAGTVLEDAESPEEWARWALSPAPKLYAPDHLRYPVVIINWVQYLGPPGPFSFPDSRDLLSEPPGPSPSQILGTFSRFSGVLPWQRESPREDPLGSGRIP